MKNLTAAAAATAKIQALDAVATNAVLGLSAGSTQPVLNPLQQLNPLLAATTNPLLATTAVQSQLAAVVTQAVQPVMTVQQPVQVLAQTLAQSGVVVPPPPMIVAPALGKPAPIPVVPVTTVTQVDTTTGVVSTISGVTAANGTNPVVVEQELQKKLIDEAEPQTLQQQESMSIKGQSARHLVMQRLMRPRESKTVILRNMVGPDEVDEMLQEEIQEECSKFGSVERVVIYKEKQSENDDDDAEIIVKIFVEFSASIEGERARDSLNGRYFGGRLVKAEMYDQALFDHQDYSG